MSVIIEHIETARRYFLLGAGFGMFRSSRTGFWGGNLNPSEVSGQKSLVAVCDARGEIGWFESSEVKVVEVDGASLPSD